MPATKLTLKLEKSIIERGKELARYRGTSLSKMIEQFLAEEAKTLPAKEYIAVMPHPDVLSLVSDVTPTPSSLDDYDRYQDQYNAYLYERGHSNEEE
ncbi:MAG: DUF6364 family protein [Bacteroidota bacterium]